MKICFARVDRIGDLILTLPVHSFWKSYRPEDQISWLANENMKFVFEAWDVPEKNVIYLQKQQGRLAQFRAAMDLSKSLQRFDQVVFFHVPWWVAFAAFLARVRSRVGVASQWYSWIFFNRRIRQKRSQAIQHESDYNRDLVQFALGVFKAEKQLKATELKALLATTVPSPYVVIHPGMGGSARNWPPLNYFLLAERLIAQNVCVVLSGSAIDESFIAETKLRTLPGIKDVSGKTTGPELLGLLQGASAVLAPSTGVLHLAASLGVPSIGIYSPVKVQAPLRWGPKGPKTKVFVPQVCCPGTHACLGSQCREFDCMNQISVDSVTQFIIDQMHDQKR